MLFFTGQIKIEHNKEDLESKIAQWATKLVVRPFIWISITPILVLFITLGGTLAILSFVRLTLFTMVAAFFVLLSRGDPRSLYAHNAEPLIAWIHGVIKIVKMYSIDFYVTREEDESFIRDRIRWSYVFKEFFYCFVIIGVLAIVFPETSNRVYLKVIASLSPLEPIFSQIWQSMFFE